MSLEDCEGLPIEAFLADAASNLLPNGEDALEPDEVAALLFEAIGLGSSAPGLAALVRAVRAGDLDPATWPSLTSLSPRDAENTIAAALVAIDPDFMLRCELLRRFAEGPPRTVRELALLVNESHDLPRTEAEVLAQPFERKSLVWEIATALDRVEGRRPPGGRHGVVAGPETDVDAPLIQLLASFRGAHRAFSGRERPWAHRPYGRPQLAFDRLLTLLGEPTPSAGFIGPAGGQIRGTDELAGVVLTIPPGALDAPTFISLSLETIGPGPSPERIPVGPLVDIQPDGLTFDPPATLRLPFWTDLQRVLRSDVTTTRVDRFEPTSGSWEGLDSDLVPPDSVVAEIARLSLYQATVGAPDTLRLETGAVDPAGVLNTAPAPGQFAFWVTVDPQPAPAPGGTPNPDCPHPDEPPVDGSDVVRIGGRFGLVVDLLPVPDGKASAVTPARAVDGGSGLFVASNLDFVSAGLVDGRFVEQGRVYRVFAHDDCQWPQIELMAGGGTDFESEGLAGTEVALGEIAGLTFDGDGNVYVAERIQVMPWLTPLVHVSRVRRIDAEPPHNVTTIAGSFEGAEIDDGPAPGTDIELNLPWNVSSLLEANGDLLFIADAFSNRVRAVNIHASRTVLLGGLSIAPGEMATVLGAGAEAVHQDDKFDLLFCDPDLPSSPGGQLARAFVLKLPTSVAVTDDALVVADTCTNRLLIVPLSGDVDPGLVERLWPPPWLPVTVVAGGTDLPDDVEIPDDWTDSPMPDLFPDGPIESSGLYRPTGLSYDAEHDHVWIGSWSSEERRISRLRHLGPCELTVCDDSPGALCDGEVLRRFEPVGVCTEVSGEAVCTYQEIATVDCSETTQTCAGAGGIAACVERPPTIPPDEVVSTPVSSNLVHTTVPAPGSVVTTGEFDALQVLLLTPIDTGSFTPTQDLRVTLGRGNDTEEVDPLVAFPSFTWTRTGTSDCVPDEDVLALTVNTSILEPGDVLGVSLVGETEIGSAAIRSVPDCPPGSGSEPVRLDETVTVRYVVADPAAGLPGAPVVATEPPGLVIDPPDPLDAAGPPFVHPHDRLLLRFSEPMAAVSVSLTRVDGAEDGAPRFRAFDGLPDELAGQPHTGLVRDTSSGLLPGAVYALDLQATGDDLVAGTVDESGQPLAGDGVTPGVDYTRYFRTSHVRILLPTSAAFVPTDLRGDPFIASGVMALEISPNVRYVRAGRGLDFQEVGVDGATHHREIVVDDLALAPDGSGRLCVEAFAADGATSLGEDCVRVFDPLALEAHGSVGLEGATIDVGHLSVRLGREDELVAFDDQTVVLPASLGRTAEVRIVRSLENQDDPAEFSIADGYDVDLPPELVLGSAAIAWRRFSPGDPLLPDDIGTMQLGTLTPDSGFVGFHVQALLPWAVGAAVPSFSAIVLGLSSEGEEWPICDPVLGGGTEAPIEGCCPGQDYFIQPEGCGCHLFGNPDLTTPEKPDAVHRCSTGLIVCCAPCEDGGSPTRAPCEGQLERAREVSCAECQTDECTALIHQVIAKTRQTMRWGAAAVGCTCLAPPEPSCTEQQDGTHCCQLQTHANGVQCRMRVGAWVNPPPGCEANAEQVNQALRDHEAMHVESRRQYCELAADSYNARLTQEFCGPDAVAARVAAERAGEAAMAPVMAASDEAQLDIDDQFPVDVHAHCDCP